MSTKRQSLDAYPCPIGIDTWCNAECAEAIDNCEAVTCLWLPVYRQAMADHKCARLLRMFVKRVMTNGRKEWQETDDWEA